MPLHPHPLTSLLSILTPRLGGVFDFALRSGGGKVWCMVITACAIARTHIGTFHSWSRRGERGGGVEASRASGLTASTNTAIGRAWLASHAALGAPELL